MTSALYIQTYLFKYSWYLYLLLRNYKFSRLGPIPSILQESSKFLLQERPTTASSGLGSLLWKNKTEIRSSPTKWGLGLLTEKNFVDTAMILWRSNSTLTLNWRVDVVVEVFLLWPIDVALLLWLSNDILTLYWRVAMVVDVLLLWSTDIALDVPTLDHSLT